MLLIPDILHQEFQFLKPFVKPYSFWQEPQVSKPKKEKVEEEKKPVEVKKFNYEDMKPIYSDEELAEIEEQEYEDENAWDDDVDYEEYDEYYDD